MLDGNFPSNNNVMSYESIEINIMISELVSFFCPLFKFFEEYSESLVKYSSMGLASFLGAYFAFKFNTRLADKKEIKEQLEELRKAIFCISIKSNKLRSIYKQVLAPHKEKSTRWCSVPSYHQISNNQMNIDFSNLGFLQSKYGRELIELHVCEESFIVAVSALNERSKFHLEKLQPAQEKALSKSEENINCNNLHEHIDMAIFELMKTNTNSCYTIFESAIDKYEKIQIKLSEISKEIYPKEKFLNYQEIFEKT